MRVVFDQGTPAPLRLALADQEVSTAFDVPELPKTASGKVQRFLLRAGA